MASGRRVALVLCGLLVVAGCSVGDATTNRQADTLALAIGYPRQDSAAGFARAALDTPLGRSPGFSLLEMTDIKAEKLGDPQARLVIRIHHEGTGAWERTVTACYEMVFGYYGDIGGASATACPSPATPITPPALPRRFLDGSPDNIVDGILKTLPPVPDEATVRDSITKALPRHGHEPTVAVTIDTYLGTVAVSAQTSDSDNFGIKCILGTRINGVSTVWRLSRAERREETGPREPWPCNPRHALEVKKKTN